MSELITSSRSDMRTIPWEKQEGERKGFHILISSLIYPWGTDVAHNESASCLTCMSLDACCVFREQRRQQQWWWCRVKKSLTIPEIFSCDDDDDDAKAYARHCVLYSSNLPSSPSPSLTSLCVSLVLQASGARITFTGTRFCPLIDAPSGQMMYLVICWSPFSL